jgi:uncharacterized protein (TIGR02996 family)
MHHPGFLRAICEDPYEDTHRLVYADWLDEHGDAHRAEFIRLQCALATMDDEDEAMKAREAELLGLHGEAWRAELPQIPRVMWATGFRRGFVESVALPHYTAWRNHGPALLAAAPLQTVCFIQVTPNTVRRLARSPGIERVRGLFFLAGNFSNLELEVLGESCRLHTFSCGNVAAPNRLYGRDAGRILGTSPGFRGLRTLALGNIDFGDEGAAAIASAPNVLELESLQLSRCHLSPVGAELLAKHASWPRLRTLDLSQNEIADAGARVLASCPGLSGLRELILSQCEIGSAGATAIARSMFLTGLRSLILVGCEIGTEGVAALASSRNLLGLHTLDLALCGITGEDIVRLLRSPLGSSLRQLYVQGNPISADAAVALVATPLPESLTTFVISRYEGADLLQRHFGDRITIL